MSNYIYFGDKPNPFNGAKLACPSSSFCHHPSLRSCHSISGVILQWSNFLLDSTHFLGIHLNAFSEALTLDSEIIK